MCSESGLVLTPESPPFCSEPGAALGLPVAAGGEIQAQSLIEQLGARGGRLRAENGTCNPTRPDRSPLIPLFTVRSSSPLQLIAWPPLSSSLLRSVEPSPCCVATVTSVLPSGLTPSSLPGGPRPPAQCNGQKRSLGVCPRPRGVTSQGGAGHTADEPLGRDRVGCSWDWRILEELMMVGQVRWAEGRGTPETT